MIITAIVGRPTRPLSAFTTASLVCSLLAFSPPSSHAGTPAPAADLPREEEPGPGFSLIPPRFHAGRLVYLPEAGYSSETSVSGGGKLRFSFPSPGGNGSVSDVSLQAKATVKGQYEAELVTNMNLSHGSRGIKAKLSYSSLPLRFYGIGSDTPSGNEELYQPQSIRAYIELFQRVFSNLRIGARYEYEGFKILEREEGGLLDNSGIKGTEGHPILGTGLLLDWDTRDNKNSPTSGGYYQAFALTFADDFGGDRGFNNYNVDLRNYFSLAEGHVLATQLFFYGARGDAPFWRLAALGGLAHTRGYRKGRYLNRILLSLQAEYRLSLWGRFGLATFAGLGDVSSDIDTIRLDHMRPTVGGGLRYTLDPKDKVKARFDVALGQEDVRLYLSMDEAF